MTDNQQPVQGPEAIREMVIAFQKARVILTAYELGIFSTLGPGGKSSEDAALVCGTDPRATDRLMNALCAAGLLEKTGGVFRNSALAAKFLDSRSGDYLEGLGHMSHMWNRWSTLTSAIRRGGSVTEEHVNRWDEEQVRSFIGAMHDRAKRQAPILASMIDLAGVKRFLDVGGGSGAFTFAVARAKEDLTAVIFDLPGVVPVTREYIAREGIEDRVIAVSGDYDADDLGDGFDMVLLSAIVHSNSPVQNEGLIGRCYRALNPGGKIVIQDFIMDETRTSPPHGTFFALNMLVGTRWGDTFTEVEIRSWLVKSGFDDITLRGTPFGTGLISGVKK